ncbi:MAG TPA: M55 family metallopeptidase [bacterium]|nr:M55 family metallopeptidase [bacterium]
MKVFISADMEGTAGVTDADQCREGRPDYNRFRRLMTEEVNAAILGALESGAKEIVVNDSHATMRNLLIEELHPQAQLVSGSPKPYSMMQGIDASFDAVFFTGYHAAAGTQDAVLDHSYSGACVRQIKLGNTVVGEPGLNSALAGHFKVPVALITGDGTAVQQLKKLISHVETVAVKEAIGRVAARSYQPVEARRRIKEGAAKALKRARDLKPYAVAKPVALEIDWMYTSMADRCMLIPGMTRVTPRATAYKAKDAEQAFTVTVACLTLARSLT